MTITDITPEEFKKQILEICDEHPEYVNPLIGISYYTRCAYQADGKNCLIGFWLRKHNLLSEKIIRVNEAASGALSNLGIYNEKVLRLAGFYQMIADGNNSPIPWGEVAEIIRGSDV